MTILGQIAGIFLLGLVGGAIPGPNLMAVFAETLKNGFANGLKVLFRAIIAEATIAIVVLLALFGMNISQSLFYIISFFGSGVLAWMELRVWKIRDIGGEGEIFSFRDMFFMTASNGLFWIFLITVCVPQAFLLKKVIPMGHILF
jgi:threonine/homoserine/homoserine lactone efflux protein